ncbi:class I SAM-dependent methyltransferase [Chitinophaga deserti]|uniref:class I SAM-dependent methyltransferase n=1 Tax=Chitinophaga deserti TaxID=2164099 RepID=UPI000D6C68C3|nr:class I SAM-dependent methyltransferase [Chitinophaga deserti]
MNTTSSPVQFLRRIIGNGGPEACEYGALNEVFESIAAALRSGAFSESEKAALYNGFGTDDEIGHTILGHARAKPFGYAGDFLIIDKIYREEVTADALLRKWDIFWHQQPATRAVRNRKDYFIRMVRRWLRGKSKASLLNIASGPGRDLSEAYARIDPSRLQTVCVEADAQAIAYATELNAPNMDHITFIHRNVFRFDTDQRFDIVWSAGLFDYFDDAVFVRLLRKMMGWTNPGGEVIIGNFGDHNPTRGYMEIISEWYLIHRSAAHLKELAISAGADPGKIKVEHEPEGVNLFLHVGV